MRKMKKVLVAINTLTSVRKEPYGDHMNLYYRLGRDFPHIEFHQMQVYRMAIDRFRNLAAKMCIQQEMDYSFFIDDDMLFQDPKTIFKQLYEAKMDIVMAHVYVRGYPFPLMAFKQVSSGKGENLRLDNLSQEDLLDSNPRKRSDGVITCEAVGTSVCLINCKLFKKLPSPWFLTGPHQTEDIYFCCNAKEHFKRVKIGMHSLAICGHQLEPEVVSYYTRDALLKYCESFMTEHEIQLQKETKEHGEGYVEENILSVLEESPAVAELPELAFLNTDEQST